ncbi:MAG: hypothetical protein M9934_04270 [Thermomicrobiales bacterium]|nr:hypothetical protein [Thermomicrobiales bacterium]
MPDPTTFSTQFVTTCATMLRHATHQRRTALCLLVLDRWSGSGDRPEHDPNACSSSWAWHRVTGPAQTYRVFSAPRVAISALQRQVIAHWLRLYARHDPVVVVVDGDSASRTGRKMPIGWGRSPRTPPWKPGIIARWADERLTPPTAEGDSRAIPLVFATAPSPTSRPWADHPPQTEWQAALEGVWIIREAMDALGEQDRPLVDGGGWCL